MIAQRTAARSAFVFVAFVGFDAVAGLWPLTSLYVDYLHLWEPLIRFVARTVLGWPDVGLELTGSGDTSFELTRLLCLVVLASLVAVVWTVLRPHAWPNDTERLLARSIVRHVLAQNMLAYGALKTFYSQFGDLAPEFLMTSWGDTPPQVLLWAFMSYSNAYETFTGLVELLGGTLLLWRRTTSLGALVSVGAMANIVMLNFCYDVPVKLLSMQLLVGGVWLLAFDARRLGAAFVLGRSVPAAAEDAWPRTALQRRAALAAKSVFVGATVLTIGIALNSAPEAPEASRGPTGSWAVVEDAPAARTWRRVVVHDDALVVQWSDGAVERFQLEHDPQATTLTFGRADDRSSWSTLIYARSGDQMTLHGRAEERPLNAKLRSIDASDFPIMQRRFRMVSDRESMWD